MSAAKPKSDVCIFCQTRGRTGIISGEHLWSGWMKPILNTGGKIKRTESSTVREPDRRVGTIQRYVRNGATVHVKIYVVCETCNNGWMSRLDKAVGGLLEPLMKGQHAMLNNDARTLIAEWVTMKIFVLEHVAVGDVAPTPIFSAATRKRFWRSRAIPSGLRIWFGCCGSYHWWDTIERHATALRVATDRPRRDRKPFTTPPNIQAVTWGIGNLVIHVLAISDHHLNRRFGWSLPTHFVPLWPIIADGIDWNPNVSMIDATIDRVASALDRLAMASSVPIIGRK